MAMWLPRGSPMGPRLGAALGAARRRAGAAGGAGRRRCAGVGFRFDRGFRDRELGMKWFPSKDVLLASAPGRVLIATSYEYQAKMAIQQARKFSSFSSHRHYWDFIEHCDKEGLQHNLHEVFQEGEPRCLYFDLDGAPQHKAIHDDVVAYLQHFVRWFFVGDMSGWGPSSPEPVVLTSDNPEKYSCHVVFPEVQFSDHAQQTEYMSVLFDALPAVVLDLEGGTSLPILDLLVDRHPYTRFQLFRGPRACKLKDGSLRPETRLEAEVPFRDDPLAFFASRVNPDVALKLPTVQELLEKNEEVRQLHEQQRARLAAARRHGGPRLENPEDRSRLYMHGFQQQGSGVLDFAGLTDLEQYEQALQCLHPDRASQYWSWFRVSGVTCQMLQRYGGNLEAQQRVWDAHFNWSRNYATYDEEENIELVQRASGKRLPDQRLLLRLAAFDNPGMEVRLAPWQHRLMAEPKAAGQGE